MEGGMKGGMCCRDRRRDAGMWGYKNGRRKGRMQVCREG
ncbi:hypothetical protein Nmel_018758 [Mimus melanotis]